MAGFRVPVRPTAPPAQRGGFAELPAGERIENLAGSVGLSPPERTVFHRTGAPEKVHLG